MDKHILSKDETLKVLDYIKNVKYKETSPFNGKSLSVIEHLPDDSVFEIEFKDYEEMARLLKEKNEKLKLELSKIYQDRKVENSE